VGVNQPTVYRLIKKYLIEKDLTPNKKGNCGKKKDDDAQNECLFA